jgi:hypothetical protein
MSNFSAAKRARKRRAYRNKIAGYNKKALQRNRRIGLI